MTFPVAEERRQNIMKAFRDYGKRLFHFIRGKVDSKEDAEDIWQDVWYQFSKIIDPGSIEQTGAWLFRVARNRIIDQYRKEQTDSLEENIVDPEDGELKELILSNTVTPETEHSRSFFWEIFMSALDELPDEQKQVFIWNEMEDISFQEIAERTGEKVSTLVSRKHYAVMHLRKRLEQLYKEIIEH